jgi:hypothetical protein
MFVGKVGVKQNLHLMPKSGQFKTTEQSYKTFLAVIEFLL